MAIDPTTGLPLLEDTMVEQIPLGTQVMPWDDLKPTQLPGRAPYYPDDVLPTISKLAAENSKMTDKVQTAQTDGKHAILVSVVNQSASSGGFPPDAVPAYKNGNSVGGVGFSPILTCDSIDSLYYVSFYVGVYPPNLLGAMQEWAIYLIYESQAHGIEMLIAGGYFDDQPNSPNSYNGSILFPGGLGNLDKGSSFEVNAYHGGGMAVNAGIVGVNLVNPH